MNELTAAQESALIKAVVLAESLAKYSPGDTIDEHVVRRAAEARDALVAEWAWLA